MFRYFDGERKKGYNEEETIYKEGTRDLIGIDYVGDDDTDERSDGFRDGNICERCNGYIV